jgi:hypothetical protein
MSQRAPAVGYQEEGSEEFKVSIGFPEEMFLHLKNRQIEEGTSFKEQVLTYIEWGMESEENALSDDGSETPIIRLTRRTAVQRKISKRVSNSNPNQYAFEFSASC